MPFTFSSINLGCDKNLVDLEFTVGQVLALSNRYPVSYYDTPEDPEVEYVFVNTCAFLSSARTESEETLAYIDSLGKKIILMWCYIPVRDDTFLSGLQHLYATLPFGDSGRLESLVTGKHSSNSIISPAKLSRARHTLHEGYLQTFLDKTEISTERKQAFVWRGDETRAYIHAPFGHEYLKIAEGCDNACTFCIIPRIRGKQTSRPIEDIVREVKTMVGSGIREIEILAQDTTRYGTDLYGEPRLLDLLDAIETVEGDFRYRVLYLYPDTLTLSHIEHLARLPRLLPYFDIPIQHISDTVIHRMGRSYTSAHVRILLDAINRYFPTRIIRTSFIIGFPGETDTDFREVIKCMEAYAFESMGIFEYHDEPLATSFRLPDKVSYENIRRRMKTVERTTTKIYAKHRKDRLGKEFSGYITDSNEMTVTIRPELHAPNVEDSDTVTWESILSNTSREIGSYVRYQCR